MNQLPSVTSAGPVLIDGKYQLTSKVGGGATSEVWEAEHILGRFACAIKIMRMSRAYFELCREEFRLLSQLYHPNIVRTFDMGFIDDTEQAYLSMEYVRGKSWAELDPKRVEPTTAISWLSQIVSVLSYLHSPDVRVIHKDIKPANIVVSGDRAVLIDFNISSRTDPDCGTPAFKCPLVEKEGIWSSYADVWALALSFHELVTGESLFLDKAPTFALDLSFPPHVNVDSRVFGAVKAIIGGGYQGTPSMMYPETFGLPIDRVQKRIQLAEDTIREFGITSRNQQFLVTHMINLSDPEKPVSKNVLIREALKDAKLPAGNDGMIRLRRVFSELKSRGVVEYSGKNAAKARLTVDFLRRAEQARS